MDVLQLITNQIARDFTARLETEPDEKTLAACWEDTVAWATRRNNSETGWTLREPSDQPGWERIRERVFLTDEELAACLRRAR